MNMTATEAVTEASGRGNGYKDGILVARLPDGGDYVVITHNHKSPEEHEFDLFFVTDATFSSGTNFTLLSTTADNTYSKDGFPVPKECVSVYSRVAERTDDCDVERYVGCSSKGG